MIALRRPVLLSLILAIAGAVTMTAWHVRETPVPAPATTPAAAPKAIHPSLPPGVPEYRSRNYRLRSDAPAATAQVALDRLEASLAWASSVLPIESGETMEVVLFAHRDQFRRAFPNAAWAEALYLKPVAYAYADADSPRFDHWLVHEAAHQFLRERSRIRAPRWIEEGLAAWFSTAIVVDGKPDPAQLDPATYPVWWFPDVAAASGNPELGVPPRSLIPASVLFGKDAGPDPNQHVNAYYVSALMLVRFLMQGDEGRYRASFLVFLDSPGTPEDFDRTLGWITDLDTRWQYAYRMRSWPSTLTQGQP